MLMYHILASVLQTEVTQTSSWSHIFPLATFSLERVSSTVSAFLLATQKLEFLKSQVANTIREADPSGYLSTL